MLSEFIDFYEELFIYKGFDGEIVIELSDTDWALFEVEDLDDIKIDFRDDISGGNILFSVSKVTGEIELNTLEKTIIVKISGLVSKNLKSPYVVFDLLFIDKNQDEIPFPGEFIVNLKERITHG